jgi:hypothetical protein
VQAALLQGHRMGLVAGSDNHAGRPGETGGLAAVFAGRLERDALISALRDRRCYATSGQRTILEFSVAGAPAGSAVTVPGPRVALEAAIHAETGVRTVEILRGVPGDQAPLSPLATLPGDGRLELALSWADPEPAPEAFYYLRVTESDGRKAWSSPVWCSVPDRAAPRRAATTAAAAAWTPQPLVWTGTTILRPSPNRALVQPGPSGGLSIRTVVVEKPPHDGSRDGLFFLLESRPIPLSGVVRARLELELAAEEPVAVTCLALDGDGVNAGLFRGLVLPGKGASRRLEQEFRPRPGTGPVTLWLSLGAQANRFRLGEVRLSLQRGLRPR